MRRASRTGCSRRARSSAPAGTRCSSHGADGRGGSCAARVGHVRSYTATVSAPSITRLVPEIRLAARAGEKDDAVGHFPGVPNLPVGFALSVVRRGRACSSRSSARCRRRSTCCRRHAVHADALADELPAQPFGVVDQRRLDRAIGAGGEIDLETGDARDQHDRRGCRFLEERHGGRDRVDAVHHVGAERLLPGVGVVPDRQRADVAHQRVDAAELAGAGGDPGAERRAVRHVERGRRRARPGPSVRRPSRPPHRPCARTRRRWRLPRRRRPRRRGRCPRGARDDGALPFQSEVHGRFLLLRRRF